MSSKVYKSETLEEFPIANVTYEASTTYKAVSIGSKLPPLPMALYHQIVSFLCDVSKEKNSEATVSLTLVKKKWQAVVWHQTTSSTLDVEYDTTTKENQALLTEAQKKAFNKIHCTIHSHNKIGASQSAADAKDEMGRIGWHATVGNCNQEKLSTHCRFTCFQQAKFNKQGEKVQDSFHDFVVCGIYHILEDIKVPEGVSPWYMKTSDELAHANLKSKYPKEWMERVQKKIYTTGVARTTQLGMTTTTQTTTTSTGNIKTGNFGKGRSKQNNQQVKNKAIDLTNPFCRPSDPTNNAWILIQLIHQRYLYTSLIDDIDNYSVGQEGLEKKIDAARLQARGYMITNRGYAYASAEAMLPPSKDITMYIYTLLDKIEGAGNIDPQQRKSKEYDKLVLKRMFENFDKNHICTMIHQTK